MNKTALHTRTSSGLAVLISPSWPACCCAVTLSALKQQKGWDISTFTKFKYEQRGTQKWVPVSGIIELWNPICAPFCFDR